MDSPSGVTVVMVGNVKGGWWVEYELCAGRRGSFAMLRAARPGVVGTSTVQVAVGYCCWAEKELGAEMVRR